LFVTGYSGNTGVFVLKIYEKASMVNVQCNTAVGIRNLPFYSYGLTTYSPVSYSSCSKSYRKGNWYVFVGNDRWVSISTCNSDTDFATEIEVYLSCEDGVAEGCVQLSEDYGCSPKTNVTFAAVKDYLYYIFVTGVAEAIGSEGFFGMHVIDDGELPDPSSSSSSSSPGSFSSKAHSSTASSSSSSSLGSHPFVPSIPSSGGPGSDGLAIDAICVSIIVLVIVAA